MLIPPMFLPRIEGLFAPSRRCDHGRIICHPAIKNDSNSAFIFARADFVNVLELSHRLIAMWSPNQGRMNPNSVLVQCLAVLRMPTTNRSRSKASPINFVTAHDGE